MMGAIIPESVGGIVGIRTVRRVRDAHAH